MGNNASAQIAPIRCLNVVDGRQTTKRFALGIIDVQYDFCKGGALAVEDADLTIAPINKIRYMYDDHIKVFVSQDWHDPKHMSFAQTHNAKEFSNMRLNLVMEDGSNVTVDQKVWPTHCVKNTLGARLNPNLIVTKTDKMIKKGTKINVESYSVFGDADKGKYEKTPLYGWLQENDITDIILVGIATDYCVYNTALDGLRLGFEVHLIMNCTRGVAPDTTKKATDDMRVKGVHFYDNEDHFSDVHRIHIISNAYSNV